MRYRRTALALVLTLGLASIPFPAHAQEEGSMSGQDTRDIQGKQIREGKKQEAGAKDKAKKENAADQGTPGAHHESRGEHDSHEQTKEGSHVEGSH